MSSSAGAPAPTSIAVVGLHSPSRLLAIAALLRDRIARHGWSERLTVTSAGIGEGAGEPSGVDVGLLAASGLDVDARPCVDLADDPGPIAEADCLLCGSQDEADAFLETALADGKQVIAFSDFLGDDAVAVEDPGADFEAFFREIEHAVPMLLRWLVARRP